MKLDRQIRYFEMQSDRSPEARFWLPLADLHLRNGEADRALALLDAHDVAASGTVSARWVMARAQAHVGDHTTARLTLAKVLDMDPAHRGAPGLLSNLDEMAQRAPVEDATSATATDTAVAEPEVKAAAEANHSVPQAPVPEPVVTAPEPTPEPSPKPEPQPEPEPAPNVFLTRTLADIYLAQGHRDKALQILYKVLSDHPGREDVVAQIAAIESDLGPKASADSAENPPQAPQRDDDNRKRFEAWLAREREGGDGS